MYTYTYAYTYIYIDKDKTLFCSAMHAIVFGMSSVILQYNI